MTEDKLNKKENLVEEISKFFGKEWECQGGLLRG